VLSAFETSFSDTCLRAKVDAVNVMYSVSIVLCRRHQNIYRNSSRGILSINGTTYYCIVRLNFLNKANCFLPEPSLLLFEF
jgi:hypothetical protein